MTSLIILILVGGGCLFVVAWGLWATPSTRDYIKRTFYTGDDR